MSDNNGKLTNQVIALAGATQAAALVDKLARTGHDEPEAFNALIHGLLDQKRESFESVFIDRQHLKSGLTTLRYLLQQADAKPTGEDYNYNEIMRYTLSMVHLENKLSGRKNMLATIGQRISVVRRQIEHFSHESLSTNGQPNFRNETVIANIASIYTDTVSTFRFRIQVHGNPANLQRELVVQKIRCMLLCGIFATILWKQAGGSRLGVLLKRKQYAEIAGQLLRTA